MVAQMMADLLYVTGAILAGTAIITSLLRFIKLDVQPFLHTKAGRYCKSLASKAVVVVLDSMSISDPLTITPSHNSHSSRGYLETLPQREGARPAITGGSRPTLQNPHLLSSAKGSENRLAKLITEIPDRYPQATYLGRSTFEPSSPTTLFARHRAFDKTKYYGEVISADAKDGLVRAVLHPNDVRVVVEKGWGQRDPLSGRLGTWIQRMTDGDHACIVEGSQVLLYPPRNQEDLDTISEIINASVWWATGVDDHVDDEKN